MKHHEKTATSSSHESQKVTDDTNKHSTKKPGEDEPHADDTVQKTTVPALIWADLLATHMPVQAWALAMMHPTPQVTDGFPGGSLTTS